MMTHKIVNMDTDTAFNTPSVQVAKIGNAVVTMSHIAHTYTTAKIVYFVDDQEKGISIGQSGDKYEAIQLAIKYDQGEI